MPDIQTPLNQSQSPKPPISTVPSTTSPTKASTAADIPTKPSAFATTPPPKAEANASIVTTRRRRSARVLEHDPILAPGFGTRKDISKLARELSVNNSNTLTVAAVEALMKSRGTGVRRSSAAAEPAAAAPPASTAWADFMAEDDAPGAATTTTTTGTAAGTAGTTAAAASTTAASTDDDSKKRKSVSKSVPGSRRVYELPIDGSCMEPGKKKAKSDYTGGVLLQAGTLDSATVGRTKSKLVEPYHLTVPTCILPGVSIAKVFTSCNAVHSIAIDSTGTAWCWGRNEAGQLGASFPAEVILPTKMEVPGGKMIMAAIGKSHTLFLMEDGSVYGVGSNKAGQCGVKSSVDLIPNYRKCVLPEDVTIVKVCIYLCLCCCVCLLTRTEISHSPMFFLTSKQPLDCLWRRLFSGNRFRRPPLYHWFFGIWTAG